MTVFKASEQKRETREMEERAEEQKEETRKEQETSDRREARMTENGKIKQKSHRCNDC
jgi:hypothetical protein